MYIPVFLRETLYGLYGRTYNVDREEIVKPLKDFNNFIEFFTREVKPRTVDRSTRVVVAPADSKVLTVSEVTGNDVLLVKDMRYTLGEFLTGDKGVVYSAEDLEKIKQVDQRQEKTKLYSAIFYLSPGDYHRYHSPCDFLVRHRKHIVGYLYPVKVSYIESTPRVYEDNERVAMFGQWQKGLMTQVYVGATNVGSMLISSDPKFDTNKFSTRQLPKVSTHTYKDPLLLHKAQEVGMFRLGSTVVMIFEAPETFKFSIKEGQSVKYGQPIGELQ